MDETTIYVPEITHEIILLGRLREKWLDRHRENASLDLLINQTVRITTEKTVVREKIQ